MHKWSIYVDGVLAHTGFREHEDAVRFARYLDCDLTATVEIR